MSWNEYHGGEKWFMENLTEDQKLLAENLTKNESFMRVAAHCIAAEELCGSKEDLRVEQILANPQERLSAVLYLLLYRGANTQREAENFLAEQRYRQNEMIEMNLKQQEKENDMQQEKQEQEKPLTDNQVELASKRKEMFVKNSMEFTEFLKQQDDPRWFIKRPYFVYCAKSYSKIKREEWQAKEAQKTVQNQTKVSQPVQEQESQPIQEQTAALPPAEGSGVKF